MVAKGYAMQLGCIVRETVPLNTQDLTSEAHEALAGTLIQKLHQRYTFLEPFNKKVDSLAPTKMSTALSSWKTPLKNKIKKGKSWEQISSKDPSLSREDFEAFKSSLETNEAKKMDRLGKENVGIEPVVIEPRGSPLRKRRLLRKTGHLGQGGCRDDTSRKRKPLAKNHGFID
jgi:hypothetical protein